MAALNAWMNGEWVGTWHVHRGTHSFTYAHTWPESEKSRPLSLSLPLTRTLEIKGDVVANYFDNLLPDNERIRERIGRRFKTKTLDAFALLEAIGRDCVGAVQLLPEGTTPDGWDRVACEPLTEAEVADALHAVPADPRTHPGNEAPAFRISLAGAQEKTAFTLVNGQWCRPLGATPSTHIFKLPLGVIANTSRVEMFNSVENEWVCAQIIEALGLPIARTEMASFGDQRALIVERFDREWMDDGKWIARLPQEDFCQALGQPPRMKYEEDGGPTLAEGLQLLSGSTDAFTDRLVFLLTQLVFWLMAAPDGHAKNFSIFLRQGNAYDMTPLYDVLSVWPYVGRGRGQIHLRDVRLAMAIRSKNTHYHLHTIQARHWHDLAMKNGGPDVWHAMLEVIRTLEPALSEVEAHLPKDFPDRIWTPIAQGMRSQAKKFLSEAATFS
ncbi:MULTISPECIES: type II toxin-antitoxin system HipA family toxin [Acidovorax]|uniref:Type II toxin-antitoxin system HipA family toxin n=1 Tax=Acidovorax facilis TaxID=12917 RepID=A0ABV8DEE2_9BURK|nr:MULTISPECIES: type II toxin-antitoxin system HipA family toxin [Acidovorax]KQB58320.1 toxin HipA [Acidovorax sp. SD340]MBO1007173.1 type II toxin-antitoxin system HipA family toxin [Acidovorax sp. SD340]MCO4242149.1 type II toxin-antitoxin system HipA family toxin [Acidovorax facilis]